jgi:outer membrane protein OmpA-like peptidoglycan-associated protein
MLLTFVVATMLTDAVEVSVTTRPEMKRGLPTVHVHILEPIAGFELKLKRSDGKDLTVRGGGKPGVTRDIELAQPEGRFKWAGELTINLPKGGTASMPLEFETEIYGPFNLTTRKEDVDLASRTWTFKATRPLTKVKLRVLMDTAEWAFDDEVQLPPNAPGDPLKVSWPAAKGAVMMMWLTAYDAAGQFNGAEFSSWFIDIPHDDVEFETGKSVITDTEAVKIEAAYKSIQEQLFKYRNVPDVTFNLYIAGHTDTVAGRDFNRTLSRARARAIAVYLRNRGMKVPIFFEGFGEDVPKVATPDETAEARNRRANYTISINPPTVDSPTFVPKWQKL